jgi:hypothetical protein
MQESRSSDQGLVEPIARIVVLAARNLLVRTTHDRQAPETRPISCVSRLPNSVRSIPVCERAGSS